MITYGTDCAQRPVLIVEDDMDAAEALKDYLEPQGFQTHLAHNLLEAERTLSTTDADVVLLDVRLGDEFGLDLIPRMRERHPDVLFIVMTAFAATDVAIEAVKRGAHDFLRKPFDPASLVAILERSFELLRARKERAAAVRELESSEANMRMAEQVGQFGSWALDLSTGEGYWSEQHHRMFGIPAGGFTPTRESFLACVHPEDREAMIAAFAEMADARIPVEVEYRVARPDGVVRTMHSAGMAARDPDGTPVRWFGMVQDITERKQAELELLRSQARLKQALDIAQLGTFEWYPAGHKLQLSPETCDILGIAAETEAEEAGDESRLIDRMHPQDLARLRRSIQEAVEQSGEFRIEYRIVSPDGQVRTIESQGQVILGDQGGSSSILGLVRDVTEHRLLEQQLRQAQKMEAVGSLAGGVAHDLNNMLQVIRGYIELELFRRKDQNASTEGLQNALKATESASLLILQLLAFARGQVLQMQPVDLNDLVAQQVLMLRRMIRQDVDISVHRAARPAIVLADKGMLEQVIVNLCVNARDAMPEGGELSLELSHWQADEAFCQMHTWARPTTYVVVAIRDTGSGMTAEVRQRIFEPFFTTKDQGKGTGLGLAMVYGIMQQHDGMVTVQSEPGSGTTFTLYLPGSEAAPSPHADVSGAVVVGGSETILVAEDEPAVRDLVVTMLTGQGYRVLTAPDGEAALRVFRDHRDSIDLALLDIVMPKLGGLAVYERLIAERPDLPVVFSTGYASESDDRDLVTRSGVPVVRKPYAPSELLQVLRKALDEKR